MKTNNILFRMAARCEAAGRPNNEDNYQLDDNLSDNSWGFTADAEVSLGEKGALLVVCDGMGGMNAGEVASDIAVKTIKEWFTTDKLTDAAIAAPCKYIASAIVAADAAIKAHSKTNPETEGMGSTIVLAWLLGQKVYVGWCGDSRCYRFNPALGLERLSHDHSYVQELVDAGKLTEELAFDHPNNNIITRSLGDPRGAAQPDCKEFDLYNQDIILLCSDGLCGTLRDNEIAELIKQHQTSMQECRDALWDADEAAGWTDNTTIALAQIISGGKDATTVKVPSPQSISNSKAELIRTNRRLKIILGIVVTFIIFICVGYYLYNSIPAFDCNEGERILDTTAVESQIRGMEEDSSNGDCNKQKQFFEQVEDADSQNDAAKLEEAVISNPPETNNNTTNSLEEIPKVETLQERTAQTINDNSQQPQPQE
ncbi:MAG: protein phosphatase 2C domain-containing protein [Paludibacteraceae bacterium]|nr:protein phosphatase 2C domain-containing protein [Paludibacteraceae bacterium]